MSKPDFDDFEAWLRWGYTKGWVSPDQCYTHDGIPMSEMEEQEYEEGDPCIHILRLYENDLHKKQVEKNSPAACWRATNRGWGR